MTRCIQKLLLIYSHRNDFTQKTMSYVKALVDQTSYSLFYISYKRVCRYFRVGILLHSMGLAGLILFWFMGELALEMLDEKRYVLFLLYGYLSVYGFTLPFFAELDVRSRYQNYKAVKDLIHVHGFQERIVKPFLHSRCQRDAIIVAAKDLGCQSQLCSIYSKAGYRWYHILPDYTYKKPKMFLTKKYWVTTLFAKKYSMKYFLW